MRNAYDLFIEDDLKFNRRYRNCNLHHESNYRTVTVMIQVSLRLLCNEKNSVKRSALLLAA
jgi:hypothetical protein